MLAAAAVVVGAMLAFATVRDPAPQTAPTTRAPEAPTSESQQPPAKEVTNDSPPAQPVVTASAVVLEEEPAPAPRPRRRTYPRPRMVQPAPAPSAVTKPSDDWMPSEP